MHLSNWLFVLMACFSFQVRQVPGPIPAAALLLCVRHGQHVVAIEGLGT